MPYIRIVAFTLLMTLALTLPALRAGQTAPPTSPPAPYHVTVTPLIPQVESGQEFVVKLRVTNASPVAQSFVAYDWAWIENWQARPVEPSQERNYVELGQEVLDCAAKLKYAENIRETIILKPGEFYEQQTVMRAWSESRQRKVKIHFLVGFTPSPEGKTPVYWSDAAAIEVVK